jgi:hypothetical protein
VPVRKGGGGEVLHHLSRMRVYGSGEFGVGKRRIATLLWLLDIVLFDMPAFDPMQTRALRQPPMADCTDIPQHQTPVNLLPFP